ncbi:MAG: GlsB/YeaQ/YmgE family stress response membrane protein [Rubrivivax sp.]|nr:GlsB/YeaQ/YmgE family stress response membrane protein [Rubrivivax sp.]
MGILGTIVVGFVVGALARFLLPGDQKMGLILTILLGIGGSLLAGFAGQAMGWYAPGQGAGWIASVVGAIVLLVVVQKLRGGSGGSSGGDAK